MTGRLAFSRLSLAAVLSVGKYAPACRHCTKQRCVCFLKIVKKEKGGRRGRGKEKEELGEGGEGEVGAEELEEDRKNFSVKKCCPRSLRLPSL